MADQRPSVSTLSLWRAHWWLAGLWLVAVVLVARAAVQVLFLHERLDWLFWSGMALVLIYAVAAARLRKLANDAASGE